MQVDPRNNLVEICSWTECIIGGHKGLPKGCGVGRSRRFSAQAQDTYMSRRQGG